MILLNCILCTNVFKSWSHSCTRKMLCTNSTLQSLSLGYCKNIVYTLSMALQFKNSLMCLSLDHIGEGINTVLHSLTTSLCFLSKLSLTGCHIIIADEQLFSSVIRTNCCTWLLVVLDQKLLLICFPHTNWQHQPGNTGSLMSQLLRWGWSPLRYYQVCDWYKIEQEQYLEGAEL